MSTHHHAKSNFWKFFLYIYVASLASSSCSYCFFYLSQSLAEFKASSTFIMVTLNAPRIILVLFMISFRSASDKISKNMMSFFAAFISLGSFLILSFSTGKVWILFSALAFGFSLTSVSTLGAVIFDRTEPAKRMKVFGIFATSYSFASLVGAALTENLYELGTHTTLHNSTLVNLDLFGFFNPLDFRTDINPSFMLLGGVFLSIIWIISHFFALRYEKKLPYYGTTDKQDKADTPRFLEYKTAMTIVFVIGFVWMSFMSFIPSYCSSLKILNSYLFFAGFGFISIMSRFVLVTFEQVLNRRILVYGALLAYISSLGLAILFPVFPYDWVLFLAGGICGFGHSSVYTVTNVLFTEITPKYTGNANFTFAICFQIGCLVSFPLGLFLDIFSFRVLFMFLILTMLLYVSFSLRDQKFQELLSRKF